MKKCKRWKGKKNKNDLDWSESSDRRGWSRKVQQSKYDKRNVECFNHHKTCYYSYECIVERGGKQKHSHDNEVYIAQEEVESEPLTLMVTNSAEINQYESWHLNSGCSNHMTSHKKWLIHFDSIRKSKVKFEDDSTLKVEGVGDMVILRKNGSKALISDVLFVLGMKCNLLNIGQLVQKRFTIVMRNSQFELFDADKRLILRSKLTMNRKDISSEY
ncbi:PREDICTED: uncharacterized protein LOC109342387 [Lupinus angustifolius]|uniref:uncharacterized protein LOC109342387 n=1 Tax=Lupinus angustifolius TaxID=3871 RepID=UPI00092E92E0|nr:PREDICTED: uncharacterized protein LOC109342387 [Lupinus angustifolius]